jgi:hypothetical protein
MIWNQKISNDLIYNVCIQNAILNTTDGLHLLAKVRRVSYKKKKKKKKNQQKALE